MSGAREDDELGGLRARAEALSGAFAQQHEHHEGIGSTNDRVVKWRR